jgi:hypothetical protein
LTVDLVMVAIVVLVAVFVGVSLIRLGEGKQRERERVGTVEDVAKARAAERDAAAAPDAVGRLRDDWSRTDVSGDAAHIDQRAGPDLHDAGNRSGNPGE